MTDDLLETIAGGMDEGQKQAMLMLIDIYKENGMSMEDIIALIERIWSGPREGIPEYIEFIKANW